MRNKFALIFLVLLLFVSRVTDICDCSEPVVKASSNYLVILVHGIAEDKSEFDDDGSGHLKPYLENALNLQGYVYAYDFHDNLGSNIVAADELGNQMIPQAINNFKAWYANQNHISINDIPQGVIPQKTILIAHSMGGLASRVYLTSDYYHDNVKKLITLDTPHLGSDAVVYKKLSYAPDTTTMNAVYTTVGISYVVYSIATHLPLWSDIYFDGAIYASVVTQGFIQPTLNDFVTKWGDPGCNEMDSEGDFIKHLKGAEVMPGKAPIEYRLVSAHGFPSPDKEGIENFHLLRSVPLINAIATPFDSRYWQLPTTQAKVESVAAAVALPGGTFVKDGSLGKGVGLSKE